MTTPGPKSDLGNVPFMRPHLPAYAEVAPSFEAVFASGTLTKGCHLREFENDVARATATSEAIGVSSCTTGLMLVLGSLRALAAAGASCSKSAMCGVARPGGDQRDEVVVPSFIFLAAPAAIVWAGYRPVFVEVDPQTYTIDPQAVKAAISSRTAAVLACHTFGCPCDIEALTAITDAAGVPLIVDAAHGFGASSRGRQVGAGGLAQVFSLSPTKLVVAGEGGVVATSCSCLANFVRTGREYGNDGRYGCDLPGVNGRLQEVSAILGRASLALLPDVVASRRAAVSAYRESLQDIPGIGFQRIAEGSESSFKDFCISIDSRLTKITRDELMGELAARGIDTRAYYSPACHQMRAFEEFVADRATLPITSRLAASLIALPMGSHVTAEVARGVAAEIRRIFAGR